MSKRMIFGTCVNDQKHLETACDNMRADSIAVTGPRFVSNYPMRNYKRQDAWVLKLPGWYGECGFAADGSGDMTGDNESDYYDERPLDLATGERIEQDEHGAPYRVHDMVRKGIKLPGDDGRLGDIRLLRRLLSEYRSVSLVEEAVKHGGTIAYKNVNNETGEMELAFDLPEAM